VRVLDGDTLDAEIDLGLGVRIQERLRFNAIQAPSTTNRNIDTHERARGWRAYAHVSRRLSENSDLMTILSYHRGKWRRWLADIYLQDSQTSLNQELVDVGYADWWNASAASTASRTVATFTFSLPRDLREALSVRAKREGLTAAELTLRVLRDYLG